MADIGESEGQHHRYHHSDCPKHALTVTSAWDDPRVACVSVVRVRMRHTGRGDLGVACVRMGHTGHEYPRHHRSHHNPPFRMMPADPAELVADAIMDDSDRDRHFESQA